MEVYAKVRHAYYNEKKSQRAISKEFGLNRRSVRKMVENSIPPGYELLQARDCPKLGQHFSWIDEVLYEDKKVHRKQKHTAQRIYERLREEKGYTGGYTIVRSYVAKKLLKTKEMFIPLSHEPGMAQCDFGEAFVIIQGVQCKAHYFVMQLPFSDAVFVKSYPVENTESFCDGHASAFTFFGGVPNRILYDNTTIAVKKILTHGKRLITDGFLALKSHYLFTDGFANVARGNEKGGVENLVGFVRRNFMVPVPNFESFMDLNNHLADCCLKYQSKIMRGHNKSVSARLKEELFLNLPEIHYKHCRVQSGKISSLSLVRFQSNDYSVPTCTGQQKVLIKGYVDCVKIIFENNVIAEHVRSYGKEEMIFDPMHYLDLLERKTGAFEQAAPLKKWKLPPIFQKVHDILYDKNGKEGRRSYIRILRLLESGRLVDLKEVLEMAVEQHVVDESAIKHLWLRHVESRPNNLSLSDHPQIPNVYVAETDLNMYSQSLLCGEFHENT